MKFSVEVTSFETVPTTYEEDGSIKRLGHHNIGFEIVHEGGIVQYAPTTIEDDPKLNEDKILEKAAREIIPGQVALANSYKRQRDTEKE